MLPLVDEQDDVRVLLVVASAGLLAAKRATDHLGEQDRACGLPRDEDASNVGHVGAFREHSDIDEDVDLVALEPADVLRVLDCGARRRQSVFDPSAVDVGEDGRGSDLSLLKLLRDVDALKPTVGEDERLSVGGCVVRVVLYDVVVSGSVPSEFLDQILG